MKPIRRTLSDENRKLRLLLYCFAHSSVIIFMRGVLLSSRALRGFCGSLTFQVVVSDLRQRMEMEVEVVDRVLGSEDPRLGQVHPATALPQLRAEMHDSHHEGGLRVPRTRQDARGYVGVLLDEVRRRGRR